MRIDVLDHGYVEFVEAWGEGSFPSFTDKDYERGIIEAARQSTQGNFRGWDQDAKLLKYLYDNKHATPFEFAGMVIEVQAPIFVFREWHRHRTQSYNETSARYAPLPDLYYLPTAEHLWARATANSTNKQASAVATEPLQLGDAEGAIHCIGELYSDAERSYQHLLKRGVPKELARLVMPVGHYSRMRASANLRNWLSFLTLRMDPKAQWEIQQYANAVHSIMQRQFPQVLCLFDNERIGIPDSV